MTGNVHVLLALAQAIVSFLPAVGPAAVRRSRSIVRRTSDFGIALIVRGTAPFRRTEADRSRIDAVGPIAACAGEALSP